MYLNHVCARSKRHPRSRILQQADKVSLYTSTYLSISRTVIVNPNTMNPIHNIRFVNTFPRLPAAAPSDHAHIISRGSYNFNGDSVNTDIQIQDAIATTLHSVSASVLEEFLGSAETVRIKFESKSPPGNRIVVMRKGSEVVVSHRPKVVMMYLANVSFYRLASTPFPNHHLHRLRSAS